VLGAVGALFLIGSALAVTGGRGISQQGSFLQSGTGATLQTIETALRRSFSVCDFETTCPNGSDDTTAIQNAITAANAAGGGKVIFPSGTFRIGPLSLSSNVHLIGNGMRETILKAKANVNSPLIFNATTSSNAVSIRDMTIDGDESENTTQFSMGCLVWKPTAVGNDGPGIMVENVLFTHCMSDPNGASAVFLWPISGWPYFSNVRIVTNNYARGLAVKSSDGSFVNLYASGNGGSAGLGLQTVQVIGAGNIFVRGYFGGSDGGECVDVHGGSYNEFDSCTVDNCWQGGYRFTDTGGTPATNNTITGGHITGVSQQTTNTYDHISFEGSASSNQVIGTQFHNAGTNKGRYALTELNTAAGNSCIGCRFGTFGTGVNNLRPSTSRIIESTGFNPQGVASITVTASPFTYTNNDNVPENIYMSGGTVSSVVKNAITIYTSSPNDMWLEPGESIIVTYTVIPTMTKDRK
jgi:hypothetical protein